MKLAFCLFNYFPYGGLQRDFLRIANHCKRRGHEIHVFTMRWEGEMPSDFHLHLIKVRGLQNHVQASSFAKAAKIAIEAEKCDLTIGFNKMPNLDIYYAADVCYLARIQETRGKLYQLLPRFRQWAALEKAVFANELSTHIFLFSAKQGKQYANYYQTDAKRFHLLPPGIDKDRLKSKDAEEIRHQIRANQKVSADKKILLMVGSGFKTKGVDRSIRALAALPKSLISQVELWVIGKDDAKPYMQLATSLQVAPHVRFLGTKDNVAQYLLAADVLLHPSYHENTGTVILEALASGLPVATVATCGYAFYVTEANAGKVLPEPFSQTTWNQLVIQMLTTADLKQYSDNGYAFANQADIYSLPEKAASLIDEIGLAHAALHR